MKRREQIFGIEQNISEFISDCKSKGLSEKTVFGYEKTLLYLFKDFNESDGFPKIVSNVSEMDVSLTSKNTYLRTLKVFLNWAYKEAHLTDKVEIRLIKGQKPQIITYTDEEVSALMKIGNKPSFSEDRTHAIVATVLATGARAGTLMNIKLDDVDFPSHYIRFSHLKNKKVFNCPMSSSLEKTLRDYIRTWELPEDGYLFCTDDGEQLKYAGLRISFDRYCSSRGVQSRGIHKLRHYFTMALVKNGISVYSLQKILTHESITTTQNYINLANLDVSVDLEDYNPLNQFMCKKIKRRCK